MIIAIFVLSTWPRNFIMTIQDTITMNIPLHLFKMGNHKGCLDQIKKVAGWNKDGNLLHLAGLSHYMLSDLKLAQKFFGRALKLQPKNSEIWLNLGVCLTDASKLSQAESAYKRSLDIDPSNDVALNNLGSLYIDTFNFDKAKSTLLRGISINPENINLNINLAFLYSNMDLSSEAYTYLYKVLKKDPENVRALEILASLNFKDGNNEDAIKLYRQLLSKDIGNIKYMRKINRLEGVIGFFDRAVWDDKIYLQYSLSDFADYIIDASLHITIDEAISSINTFCKQHTFHAYDYANLSIVFLQNKLPVLSFKCAEIGLTVDPHNETLNTLMGAACAKLDDNSSAIAYFFKALSVNDENADVLNSLGLALMHTQNYHAAEINFLKAIRLRSNFYQCMYNLSHNSKCSGKYDQAIYWAEKSLAIKDTAEARFNLGLAQMASGDIENGYRGYAYRFDIQDQVCGQLKYGLPRLKKLDDNQQRILISSEQGVGDLLMYLTLLHHYIPRWKNITIEVDVRFVDILSRSFPEIDVRGIGQVDEDSFDYQIPVGDLASLLNFNGSNFMAKPYLKTNINSDLKWAGILDRSCTKKYKVGLQWSSEKVDSARSASYTNPSHWVNLFRNPLFSIVSINYHNIDDDILDLDPKSQKNLFIPDLDQKNNLDETASLIKNLDFVVTPASTPGVISAALGVPNYQFVESNSEYNLGLANQATPWRRPHFPSNVSFSIDRQSKENCVDELTSYIFDIYK